MLRVLRLHEPPNDARGQSQSSMHARQTLSADQPYTQKKQLIYVSNYQYNHSPVAISVAAP